MSVDWILGRATALVYLPEGGIEVKAELLKRNPSTLTAPVVALNSTAPRWPATDSRPGTERSTIAVRAPGPKVWDAVPITWPATFSALMFMDATTPLGVAKSTAWTTAGS